MTSSFNNSSVALYWISMERLVLRRSSYDEKRGIDA